MSHLFYKKPVAPRYWRKRKPQLQGIKKLLVNLKFFEKAFRMSAIENMQANTTPR
jgi:hypothetical protein